MPEPVRVDDDVFCSPALPLLVRLEAEGFTFKLENERVLVRPVIRLCPEDRALLAQYRDVVRVLLEIALDEGVQQRLAVFKAQVAQAPAGTLPVLVFTPGVSYQRGMCFSCGAALATVRFGRGWACSVAWRMAVGVSVSPSLAAAMDEARVI